MTYLYRENLIMNCSLKILNLCFLNTSIMLCIGGDITIPPPFHRHGSCTPDFYAASIAQGCNPPRFWQMILS